MQLSANRKEYLSKLRAEAERMLGYLDLNMDEVLRQELEVLGMAMVRTRGRPELTKDERKRIENPRKRRG